MWSIQYISGGSKWGLGGLSGKLCQFLEVGAFFFFSFPGVDLASLVIGGCQNCFAFDYGFSFNLHVFPALLLISID